MSWLMVNRMKLNRDKIDKDLRDSPVRQYFSPIYYGQYQTTLPLMRRHVCGKLIDLGCGQMPFRRWLAPLVEAYDTLDHSPEVEGATYVGDIQEMSMIGDEVYDSAICLEVLEHIPDPFKAARETARILKPGGVLIVSVPHLSRLHQAPQDYYRYTRYGITQVLEGAGFKVQQIQRRGGLASFLGHQVSTILLSLSWGTPILKQFCWGLNRWLVTYPCYALDRWTDKGGVFAVGHTVVARRQPS